MTRTQATTHGGFTLIELLIAIVVIGALTALAFPRYGQFSERMALQDGRSSLRGLATQARSRALSRGAPTRLQVTADSAWIEMRVADAWQPTGISEPSPATQGLGYVGPAEVTFLPTGAVVIPGGAPALLLSVTYGSQAKVVTISRYGRIQ